MLDENIEKLYNILEVLEESGENINKINKIRELIEDGYIVDAVNEIKKIKEKNNTEKEKEEIKEEKEKESNYPQKLIDKNLEETYIGLLLNNPKLISKYYILFEECYFDDESLLNIYKSILFTEGGK